MRESRLTWPRKCWPRAHAKGRVELDGNGAGSLDQALLNDMK